MGNAFFIQLIEMLNTVSPVWVLILEVFIAYGAVIAMFHFFGKDGLFVYVTMAVILANIQVLKVVVFPGLPDPIALGTVVFVSTYLAVEIVNEHYGKTEAMKMVMLSFVGYFLFALLMVVALSFRPLDATAVADGAVSAADCGNLLPVQKHLMAIFAPAPSIFIASLTSFVVSQVANVHIFSKLKVFTHKKMLWLRGAVSSSVGTLLDNFIFSVVAFVILAHEPLPWSVVICSYVLGVFVIRFGLALLETPMLYLSLKLAPKK